MNDIDKIRAKRFHFLKRIYELSEGNQRPFFDAWEIGKEIGLDQSEIERITQYLEGEGLIVFRASMAGIISITHRGVVEIEEALNNPDSPTQYFPAVNIINVGTMINSQIQQSSTGGTQVLKITDQEKTEIELTLSEIESLIDDFNFTVSNRQDLNSEIATIKAQLKTSNPKKSIIKECLTSVRNILEQVGAALLAAKIASLLNR